MNRSLRCKLLCAMGVWIGLLTAAAPAQQQAADSLKALPANVFAESDKDRLRSMVRNDQRKQLGEANDRSRNLWYKVANRDDWEAFRDPRIEALQKSLGNWPDPPKKMRQKVTGTVQGDGYVIENIVFESRPNLWVTANLYRPEKPTDSMPGFIISHSHHRPKQQGELQDMGMLWARAGCIVLVPDHLGHGERGQHGFFSSSDFPREFAVSRQDYYFRYDNSMQLYLVGESLMGWMAWDLMRGVDILLEQKGIDPKRITLLGAVAGGGDPAAVTGALDERITCVAPFNFGGPQPETRYPLPEDAEITFNYAGSGGWESTRNLDRSAGDGFLPWVIVGGIAPRRLIFSHEFSWDRERDPVWKWLGKIYEFHGAADHRGYALGRGELKGRPPEASHCTNIGRFHRERIHAHLADWFNIKAQEYSNNRPSSELMCMTDDAAKELKPRLLHAVLTDMAGEQVSAVDKSLLGKAADEQRKVLQNQWRTALRTGAEAKVAAPQANVDKSETIKLGDSEVTVRRVSLPTAEGIEVPLLLLQPAKAKGPTPVVVAVAQGGKAELLKQRAQAIASLLDEGNAVCLVDVRNTGETREGNDRGRYSAATARAASELMLGGTMIGRQLHDLRSAISWLRMQMKIDGRRIALWSESFAPLNDADTNLRVPRRIDGRPRQAEPGPGLLVLLAALYEDDIQGVYVQRGLANFRSALDSPFVNIPLDSVVPGAIKAGDVPLVAAALAPTPLALNGTVDGDNRPLELPAVKLTYDTAVATYAQSGHKDNFQVTSNNESPAKWLAAQLKK